MKWKRTLRFLCACVVWLAARLRLVKWKQDFLAVLYYHNVGAYQRRRFTRQLEGLARWGTLGRVLQDGSMEGLDAGDGRPCYCLTFDDALEGVFRHALPEILGRNMSCVIFVPTGYLGAKAAWKKEWACAEETVIDGESLVGIDRQHVTLGSHTISHPDLTTLSSQQLTKELVQSRADLEKALKCTVGTFSFPHGKFNQAVMKTARDAGYRRVFTIEPFLNDKDEREYIVHRIAVDPEDWPTEFYLKVNGYYVPFERMWRGAKRLIGWNEQEKLVGISGNGN